MTYNPPIPEYIKNEVGEGVSMVKSWTRNSSTHRVRSFAKMDSLKDMSNLEKRHRNELGPEFGFDLNKIYFHYNSRRDVRLKYEIFTYGKTIPLKPKEGTDGKYILCFARVLDNEIAVVMTNFADGEIEVGYDTKDLKEVLNDMQSKYFPEIESKDSSNFELECGEDAFLNMNILLKSQEIFHNSPEEILTPRELILGQGSHWIKAHSTLAFM